MDWVPMAEPITSPGRKPTDGPLTRGDKTFAGCLKGCIGGIILGYAETQLLNFDRVSWNAVAAGGLGILFGAAFGYFWMDSLEDRFRLTTHCVVIFAVLGVGIWLVTRFLIGSNGIFSLSIGEIGAVLGGLSGMIAVGTYTLATCTDDNSIRVLK